MDSVTSYFRQGWDDSKTVISAFGDLPGVVQAEILLLLCSWLGVSAFLTYLYIGPVVFVLTWPMVLGWAAEQID